MRSWGPSELIIMSEAFELTMHRLGNPGIDYDRKTRELIARAILAAAEDGGPIEAERLSDMALAMLGVGGD